MTIKPEWAGLHFHSVSHTGLAPGPRLIVSGAVHGNETCGTEAIRRVLGEIDRGELSIAAGLVTFVPIANPLAHSRHDRAGDRNLNRNLGPASPPVDFEDHIANWLCPLLAQHEVLLDLHSTRAQNPAFAMLGPENNSGALEPFAHFEQERALATRLGVQRFVDGWLDTYATGVARRIARTRSDGNDTRSNWLNTDPRYGVGTTEYMRSVGGYAITLECGQHDDPASPDVAYRAIHNSLAFLGISRAAAPPVATGAEYLHMYDVIDRMHDGDAFSRAWASFDRLKAGDVIGMRHDGAVVRAELDGYIMFPDAKSQPGQEWFYLASADSAA